MSDKPPQPPTSPDTKQPSTSIKPKPKQPYISRGEMLDSPPLAARFSTFIDNTYNFFGLYLTSLFSLDAYEAARASRFNTHGPGRNPLTQNSGRSSAAARSTGTGMSGPRGGGGGGGGGSGPGRRLGTVDDVRGPECGSCG